MVPAPDEAPAEAVLTTLAAWRLVLHGLLPVTGSSTIVGGKIVRRSSPWAPPRAFEPCASRERLG